MRASADLTVEENVADANALRRMLEAVDGCPAPVVAAVHGYALGGGVGLVACSDVVLMPRARASPSARASRRVARPWPRASGKVATAQMPQSP